MTQEKLQQANSILDNISHHQTNHSELWGLLTFFPYDGDNRCRKCLLCRSGKECLQAPCEASERNDKMTGYFSIHQMPIV